MTRLDVRRWLSFGILITAGLASLATTQAPPSIQADKSGSSSVSAEGADLTATVRLSNFSGDSYDYGTTRLQFDLLAAPGQFFVTSPTGESENSRDDPQAFSIDLSTAECEDSCAIDHVFHVELVDPAAGPVVVPWHVNANVTGSGEISLDVQPVEANLDVMSVALAAGGAGMALGLFLLVPLLLRRERVARGLAFAEAAASSLLIGGGAFVGLTLTVDLALGGAGLLMITVGLCAAFGGLVTRSWLERPGLWLLPVGGFALPLVLARLLYAGAFRSSEVVVAMVISGFAFAICVAEAVYVIGSLLKRVDIRTAHVLIVLVASGFVVVVSAVLSIATVTTPGTTVVPVLLFSVTGAAAALALWRWLSGDSLYAFISALFSMIISALVAVGAAATEFMAGAFGGGLHLTLPFAATAVAVAALVLVILVVRPPPLRDSNARGETLQTSWQRS